MGMVLRVYDVRNPAAFVQSTVNIVALQFIADP